jgi:integrase
MNSDAIDRVVRKFAAALGLDRGYSAHSMRATFITTALEKTGAALVGCKAAGHRAPSTTKLYGQRVYNPRKRKVPLQPTDIYVAIECKKCWLKMIKAQCRECFEL